MITKIDYEKLKEYWDFQRKKQYQKDWIRAVVKKASEFAEILGNENEMIDTMPSLLDIYKERIHHIFTSSKTGLNIDEVFKMGVKESHSIYLQEKENKNKNENENENQKKTINLSYRKSNKSSCCY